VPPSVPNKTLVPASCSEVKRDVSGMVVATVFFVRYTTVRSIQNSLLNQIMDYVWYSIRQAKTLSMCSYFSSLNERLGRRTTSTPPIYT
jgi:hypothetical protein